MPNPRILPKRMQSVLAMILIGALLTTSLPLATSAAAGATPAAKAITASNGTVAPSGGAVKKGAVASHLAALRNSKAAPSVALQEKLPKGSVCSALTPRNGPSWGDRQGWNAPEYYETIKLADIDGDNSAELLGRAVDGLKVYGWSKDLNRWLPRRELPVLSDALGNNKPQYYQTIQFANLDNQPGAELLFRGPRGVEVYGYDKGTDNWTHLTGNYDQSGNCDPANGLPASDACGFDASPSYYETIQTADLDGDKQPELLARGRAGIYVWKWDIAARQWKLQDGVLALTDDEGWNQPQYYLTIQTADLDGAVDGAAELIARGADGVHTYKWRDGTWTDPYGLLALSNATGWNNEQNYLTIQTADLDGNGQAELLARSSEGLYVFRLENGVWAGPLANLALSDAGRWNQPQYYRTIQTADLDGDKKAEVIARGQQGLLVYTFNGLSFAGPQATFRLMNDNAGWDQPSSYLTIQTADVDGDKRADIIGRSHKELETLHYDAKRGLYQRQLVPTFPAFTGSQLAVYQYLSSQLLSAAHPDRNDMRKVYADLTLSSRFNEKLERLTRPEQFAAADWDPVYQQLDLETTYLQLIKDWFDFQLTVTTQFGLANKESFDTISGLLNLKTETTSTADIVYLVFKSLLAVAATLIPEGGPEVKAILEGIKKAVELTETAIETAQEATEIANGEGGDEEFDDTVAEMRKELSDNYENSITALDCLYDFHLKDWDLMQSLADPILSGEISSDPGVAADKFQEVTNHFKLEIWQALTAVHWEILRLGFGESEPPEYVRKYYYITPSNDYYYLVLNESGYNYPTQATFEALFEPDSTGWPGVKVEDIFRSRNGWHIPGALSDTATDIKSGSHCVTRCFRAPEFYWRNASDLPPGRVRVAGSFFNNQISTSDEQALRRILSAGGRISTPTPLEEFNQQFVALQLNLMSGPTLTDNLLQNELTCYRARFGVVRLSNGVQLTSGTSLKVLLEQVWLAALGNRGADFAALATVMEALNGNDPNGHCSTTYQPR